MEVVCVCVYACMPCKAYFKVFFFLFCISALREKSKRHRWQCGKNRRHRIVSFIFTLVKRRATQMRCYYPSCRCLAEFLSYLWRLFPKKKKKKKTLQTRDFLSVWGLVKLFLALSPWCGNLILHKLRRFLRMDANEAPRALIRRPTSNPVNNTMAYCGWIR